VQIRHDFLGAPVGNQDLAGTSFGVIPANSPHSEKVVSGQSGLRMADGRDPLVEESQHDRRGGLPTERRGEPGGDRHAHQVQIEIAARCRARE